ncbi:folliculin-interacting protein 1-like isoform X1 [Styela clava]
METVFHKFFVSKNGKKSSKQFGIFCRKNRQTPAVIELPAKQVKTQHEDDAAIVVAKPPPDVRLVLFQECGETSDRKLIFDSKSFDLQKQDEDTLNYSANNLQHGSVNNNSKSHQQFNSRYQYVRGPQDSGILSEMLFGAVGLASRASSLKIHVIKEPQRIMLSRVFCVEYAKESVSLDRGIEYQRPAVLSRRKAKTLPVPTPEPSYIPPPVPSPAPSLASSLTSRITRSDSSSSLMSLTSILGASLGGTGSLGSRSMPQHIPSNRASHSLPPAHRQASRDSFTLTQEPHHGIITSRRTKVRIGFAVIFQPEPSNSSEFHHFFFEHFPLIESYLTYLKEQIESALNSFKRTRNQEFIECMMEILHIFTSCMNSIYSTPRLLKPVWSSLTTVTSPQRFPWLGDDITVKCFIADLARMVTQHNTKNKNYFMSGLISSVLTHHLGWVNTMLPPSGETDLQTLAYNPLWAQLGDIYGAVGTPTKVAKTLILGEIHELVSTIISILSYFIRSSDVTEVVDVPSDMTPQAFLEDDQGLTMSLVPSDLEPNEYVFVTMDADSAKTENNDSAIKNIDNPAPPKTEKPKFSFCRKNKTNKMKTSEPIAMEKLTTDKTLSSSLAGTSLCRSKSSPGSAKPPIPRVNRQKSIGNMELTPTMRLRTNSNDTLARPRGVQSRRTSHEVSNISRMSKSSSALVISNIEKLCNEGVSSLEGSKSFCGGPMPASELLQKRLGKENIGSCPNNVGGQMKNLCTPSTRGQQNIISESITALPVQPILRQRTHKRGSSEPFNVNLLRTTADTTSSSLVKTKSTYFPVVRKTFVDTVEPRVVNAIHVQREQPVIAMNSPSPSPLLPRSKSSAGQRGPIIGFRTPEAELSPKKRSKHKSGSFLQEKPAKIDSPDFRDVFSPKNNSNSGVESASIAPGVTPESKFNFNDPKVHRSSSNASVSSVVRRSSSAASNKVKLAGRRRKLTDSSSKQSSIDESEEKISGLPPLCRIPSVALEHEKFDEYFNENGENSEFIFFSAHKSSNDLKNNQGQTQSSVTKPTDQNSQNQSSVNKTAPPPLPTKGPCQATLEREKSPAIENKSTVTKSLKQKAENHSSVTKRQAPPLPTTGPSHRSQSTKSETVSKFVSSPNPAPKSAPPLPLAPPIHHGSLYPKLDEISTPSPPRNGPQLPKSSIYPNLDGKTVVPTKTKGLYPNLDEDLPSYEEVTNSLYPKLPTTPSCDNTSSYSKNNNGAGSQTLSELPQEGGVDDFSSLEEVPLRPVQQTKVPATKKSENGEDSSRLTFGELMADYSPEYLWGFALHGTRNQSGLYRKIIRELQHSVQRPVLDEPVSEAVSIVADTDKWTVKVLSTHRIHSDNTALPALNSKLVTNILERITKLYQINAPAEFCMQQLENSLGELVLKSRMLAGYVVGNTRVNISQLSAVLGIESSDLPLLMSIASCHSPQVAAKLL